MAHREVEPSVATGWASWWCVDDDTPCASDNPCDCCVEATVAWLDPRGAGRRTWVAW